MWKNSTLIDAKLPERFMPFKVFMKVNMVCDFLIKIVRIRYNGLKAEAVKMQYKNRHLLMVLRSYH